jgi:hypothetical protein
MLGRKLYSSDPLPIVVRELLQNSVDACKRKGVEPDIRISILKLREVDLETVLVTCTDNGIGMTADQIVNDFLCLGGKKADGSGQTGGFGIAKAAILGGDNWAVRSLDNYLNKEILENGAVIEKRSRMNGTKVSVLIESPVYFSTVRETLQMIYYSDVRVRLTVRMDYSPTVSIDDPVAGFPDVERKMLDENKDFDFWGCEDLKVLDDEQKLSMNDTGWTIVRLNGLMQFRYGSHQDYRKNNLFFDIKTDKEPESPDYPFSMSRESLVEGYDDLISAFVETHNANVLKSTAVVTEDTPENKTVTVLQGRTIRGTRETKYKKRKSTSGTMGNMTQPELTVEQKVREFKNSSKAPVKLLIEHYDRDPAKKGWHSKLLLAWQDVLTLVAADDDEFGIGITSDGWRRAARVRLDFDTFYILNPDLAVTEELRKQSDEAIVLYLWSLACHEVTHQYIRDHNEWFSSTRGDIMRDSAEVIYRCLGDIVKRLQ